MSPIPRLLLLGSIVAALPALASAQWQPHFELRAPIPVVANGGLISVEVWVSNVLGNVAGYQAEILFDQTRLDPVAITQGPYLAFNTFFGNPGAFPDKVRIGALNFPTGSDLPPGPGQGLIATVVFNTLREGPANLDLTSFCLMACPGGTGSKLGTRADLAVQVLAPTDSLMAFGRPNPAGTIALRYGNPTLAGKMFVTASSFSNTGIPIPGVGILPLGFDPLFQMAFANCCVYGNSVGTLDGSGSATTTFRLPNDPRVVGLRVWFGSLIFQITPSFQFLGVSSSTWTDYLAS
jgi:hypothetical protein